MTNNNFRDFLIAIIYNLEPNHYKRGVVIGSELDEFGEIIFVYDGSIGIGYELNKFRKIVF